MKKKIHFGLMVIGVIALITNLYISAPRPSKVDAFGNMITNFNSFSTSSARTVTSSSGLLVATNTARTYMEISNLGNAAVFCALKGGDTNQAAVLYSGKAIFASSTAYFKIDENPYVGPVHCISTATMQVSVLER